MESNNKLLKIQEILQEELNLDEAPAASAVQTDISEWDSMAYMSVVARVEEEFSVEATPENIQKFDSVQGILNLVEGTS